MQPINSSDFFTYISDNSHFSFYAVCCIQTHHMLSAVSFVHKVISACPTYLPGVC